MPPRRAAMKVPNKILPLQLETVLIGDVIGHFFPLIIEVHALWDVRVPDRSRRVDPMLRKAARQTGDRRAVRAVDMKDREIIPPHPHCPGRVDVRYDAIFQLEGCIRCVVNVRLVGLSIFVDTGGNMRCAKTTYSSDRCESVIEHVSPMAQHIENDAAAFGLLVVPARSLRRLPPVALEYPITKLTAYGEHAPEEAGVA